MGPINNPNKTQIHKRASAGPVQLMFEDVGPYKNKNIQLKKD